MVERRRAYFSTIIYYHLLPVYDIERVRKLNTRDPKITLDPVTELRTSPVVMVFERAPPCHRHPTPVILGAVYVTLGIASSVTLQQSKLSSSDGSIRT